MFGLLTRWVLAAIQIALAISGLLPVQAQAQSTATTAATSIPYTMMVRDVSGSCTLMSDTFSGVLTPTGQANTYTTLFAGGAVITLTVPGSNALVFSFPDGNGTTNENMQLTFDLQSHSITGSTNWTHTNGCIGYTTISGSWADSSGAITAATFPIANTPGRETSAGAAFDGTNFLVGIQGDATADQSVTAQFVSKTGSLVGSRISTGAKGGTPRIAFDGTNFLLVWECDGPVTTCIAAQFVSTSGALIGTQFTIATGTKLELGFPGLIFDGANYFVAWRNIRSTAGSADTSDLLGQFLTTGGAKLGSVVTINTASYEQVRPAIAIAFDGANILAVWADGRNQRVCYAGSGSSRYCYETDIYGQFIAKSSAAAAGTLAGGNFLIDAGLFQRDNPGGIGFDGTNYLVTFVEATANPCPSCNWDGYGTGYGILVSKTGTVIGSKFVIGSTGYQRFPMPNYVGSKYLVTWTDRLAPLSASIKGQYVATTGAVAGSEFALFSPAASGAVPWIGVVLTGGGASLAVASYGIPSADVMGSILTVPSQSGAAIVQPPVPTPTPVTPVTTIPPTTPLPPPPAVQTVYAASSGQLPEKAVEVTATGTFGNASLSVTLDIVKVLQAAFAASPAYNVYVAAMVPGALLGSASSVFYVKPKPPANWSPLTLPIAAYMEDVAQFAASNRVTIDILTNTNISSLAGTEVYVGYGTSSEEMLAASRYRGIYKVQ